MIRLLCFFLLFILHSHVWAGNFKDECRHEFRLGIGIFPIGDYGVSLFRSCKTVDLLDLNSQGDTYTTGCIFGKYSYWLFRCLKLGVSASYDRFWCEYPRGNKKVTYVLAMPYIEFSWVNIKYFRMYSSLGVGVTFVNSRDSGISENNSYTQRGVHFTYLGVSAGHKFFAFAECGVGAQGVLAGGIGYRF